MKSILTFLLYFLITASFAQTEKTETIIVDDLYGNSGKSLIRVDQPKINLHLSGKPGSYLSRSALSLVGAILTTVIADKVADGVYQKGNTPQSLRVYMGGALIITGLFAYATYNFIRAGDELITTLRERRRNRKIFAPLEFPRILKKERRE